MAKYIVARDHIVQEFGVDLREGDLLEDGDLEPDLMAQLQAAGVIESKDQTQPEAPAKAKRTNARK